MSMKKAPMQGWLIVALLFGFMMINFADKAVFGLSAIPIIQEFEIDHTIFGLIGSGFFLFFSVSAVSVGFVANRKPTQTLLFALAMFWTVLQLPMILSVGLVALIANRILLGLGEGPAYPLALHALYKWFPDLERPLPTSLIILGSATGLWAIAPAIVYVIVHYSWRAAFSVLGLVSLTWCIVWLFVGDEGPLAPTPSDVSLLRSDRTPYLRLLGSRTFLATVAVAFAAYWLATLAVVWLPAYLTVGAGYTQAEVGWIVTLPTLGLIVVMLGGAALSQWLMRRGASSRWARGGLSCAGLLIGGLLLLALPWVSSTYLVLLCVALAVPCGNLIVSLGYVTVAEISPISQRGAMLAITNAIAALAGPLAPPVMGLIVDSNADPAAGFRIGFMMVGAIVAVVALLAMFLMDPESDRARYAKEGSAFGLESDLSP